MSGKGQRRRGFLSELGDLRGAMAGKGMGGSAVEAVTILARERRNAPPARVAAADGSFVTLTGGGEFFDGPAGDAVQSVFTIPAGTPTKLGVLNVVVQPSNGPGLFAEVGLGVGVSYHMWVPSTLGGGAGAWPQLFGAGTTQVNVQHEGATAGTVAIYLTYFT